MSGVTVTSDIEVRSAIDELTMIFIENVNPKVIPGGLDLRISKRNVAINVLIWLKKYGVPDEVIEKIGTQEKMNVTISAEPREFKVYGVDSGEFYFHHSLTEFKEFYQSISGYNDGRLNALEINEYTQEGLANLILEGRKSVNGGDLTVLEYMNNLIRSDLIAAGQKIPKVRVK